MTEISLDFLWKVFKKTWWRIAIITILVMVVAACFTHFLIPKKYSSKTEFYIVNVNPDSDYTSASLLSAASYLVNDYVTIIKSDYMLDQVVEKLKEQGVTEYGGSEIKNATLRGMISSDSSAETSAFSLKVLSQDAEFSYKVASVIAEIAPEVVTKMAKPEDNTIEKLAETQLTILRYLEPELASKYSKSDVEAALAVTGLASSQLNCVEVLTPPVLAESHDSPSMAKNMLLSGILAAVGSYAIFFLIALLNMTVTSEDDVKKQIECPLIGTIPRWEIGSNSK